MCRHKFDYKKRFFVYSLQHFTHLSSPLPLFAFAHPAIFYVILFLVILGDFGRFWTLSRDIGRFARRETRAEGL